MPDTHELGKLRQRLYPFVISFVAAVGGFLFGYDLALIATANPFLKEQFHLSDVQLGFATASAGLGCAFGPFLGGWLCDAIGRKRTLIAASLLLGVSAIMTAIPEDIITFNIFRLIGGVGVGLCSVASPMYIAEIAPPRKRGRLGLMYQLAIVVGHVIAPFIAYFLVKSLPDTLSWRWMFASEVPFVILFVIFLFSLPLSPRWLAERGRFDEALDVLTKVEGPEYARQELQEIKDSLAQETGGFSELFSPGLRSALLVGLGLAVFNHWTGWSVFAGYIPLLFEMSGLEDRSVAILRFTLTYFFMGLMTLVALWVGRPGWKKASVAVRFCSDGHCDGTHRGCVLLSSERLRSLSAHHVVHDTPWGGSWPVAMVDDV